MPRSAWFPVALVVWASAVPFAARADEKTGPKLAATHLSYVNLPGADGDAFLDRLVNDMRDVGIQLITARHLQSLLSIERQRQISGCADDATNCLAELADALGVDGILTGSLSKYGNAVQVTLSALSTHGELLASFSGVASGPVSLGEVSATATREMAADIGAKLHKPVSAWPHNVISINPLGAIVGRYDLQYERIITDRFSLLGILELHLGQVTAIPLPDGRVDARSDELVAAVAVRRYLSAPAPKGWFLQGSVTFASTLSAAKGIGTAQIGAFLVATGGYSWLLWHSWTLGFGASLGLGPEQVLRIPGDLTTRIGLYGDVFGNVGYAF